MVSVFLCQFDFRTSRVQAHEQGTKALPDHKGVNPYYNLCS